MAIEKQEYGNFPMKLLGTETLYVPSGENGRPYVFDAVGAFVEIVQLHELELQRVHGPVVGLVLAAHGQLLVIGQRNAAQEHEGQ